MNFEDFLRLDEITSATSRYSVEVNYRTTKQDALDNFSKITLGYVSAALKAHNYHTRLVLTEKPWRLFVSSRNWDQGEWVVSVTWNHEHHCFVISKGFYNKERRTISIQSSHETKDDASGIAKDVVNMMHHLKSQPDRWMEKLKPAKLRPGPKT